MALTGSPLWERLTVFLFCNGLGSHCVVCLNGAFSLALIRSVPYRISRGYTENLAWDGILPLWWRRCLLEESNVHTPRV